MNSVGEYLRDIRKKLGYSMDTVKMNTGITDSKISRIESGKCHNPSVEDLKTLATFYCIDLVDLYLRAGYLTQEDFGSNIQGFSNAYLLSDEEKSYIQNTIDFLLQHRKQKEEII